MPSTERERAEQSGTETVWDKNKDEFRKYDHSSQASWNGGQGREQELTSSSHQQARFEIL